MTQNQQNFDPDTQPLQLLHDKLLFEKGGTVIFTVSVFDASAASWVFADLRRITLVSA